jgi:hypothetical protein
VGVGALAFAVGACSGSSGDTSKSGPTGAPSAAASAPARSPSPRTPSTATAAPAQSSSSAPRETTARAPRLIEGEKELASAQAQEGNGTLPPVEGVRKGVLTVLVNCQGGKLRVVVDPITRFDLDCPRNEVLLTLNKIQLKKAHPLVTFRVEAPEQVKWSMTVGR